MDGITDSMDMSLSKPLELVTDTEAWRPSGHGVPKSQPFGKSQNQFYLPTPSGTRVKQLKRQCWENSKRKNTDEVGKLLKKLSMSK